MQLSVYETHNIKDKNFPFIFHLDVLSRETNFQIHWHENLELLYFVEGEAIATADGVSTVVQPNTLVVFNSNHLHKVEAITENCKFYCLIVDKSFCEGINIQLDDIAFEQVITTAQTQDYFNAIISEMEQKDKLFRLASKSLITTLLVHLFRNHAPTQNEVTSRQNQQSLMIKQAIEYMNTNYSNHITIEDVASHVGFSKFYFCREFKAVTGKTVIDFLNFIRCKNARHLLSSKVCNVTQAGLQCGFQNISYFSKTYYKQIGVLPHQEQA